MAISSRRDVSRSGVSRTGRGAIRRPTLVCAGSLPIPRRSLARRTCCCATPKDTHTTPSRSISRAAVSRVRSHKPHAARHSRSPPRKSSEHSYGTLHRHFHISRRRLHEGHRRPKYAAEFNVPGLAYGSVVTSTIAKGRILRIDPSDALRVKGVLDVLTHENRPPMADNDEAYKDEVAPTGSPFRPLYDSRIVFNGQPIALVVAETSEFARFAASLVRVEYEKDAHITDVYCRREAATPVKPPTNPLEALFTAPKTRGRPEQALAAAAVRHAGEYYVPIEHHNPMELFAATAVHEAHGKLTVYDKTQGVQNVQHYLCGVFGMKPEDVRVMSAFMGGGFGSGLRPQFEVVLAVLAALALKRSVRVVLTRPQMYGLGYRPAMIQRIELGASTHGTLEAITHDAITVTSQYEDFFRQETGWSGLLYKSTNAKYV